MAIAVSIVEDNEQLRSTLARVIGRADGFQCVSQYGSAEAALEGLPKDKAQVVLMDINLPGMNGVECVRQLKQTTPSLQFIMLTVYEDTDNIFNALAAGAAGYLLKRTKSAELLEAIREVNRGGSPMTTHIARKVTQSFQRAGPSPRPTENLSEREQEVLDCLSQGFLYKEIAEKLGISYETVHTYIRRIYEKLQVRTPNRSSGEIPQALIPPSRRMRGLILIAPLLFTEATLWASEPRSLPKPLRGHPGNVFLAGENVVVTLPQPKVSPTESWLLADFEDHIVAKVTNSNGQANLSTLPVGYYELRRTDEGPAEVPLCTIAVLTPLRSPTRRISPIGVDVGKAWAYPSAHQEAIASLCALAGISWVRDRVAWRDLEPSKGEFAESAKYDEAARKLASAGLQVLRVYHDSPTWANTNPKRMPPDLRDAYNFARTIAGRCAGQVSALEPWNEADIEAFGGHTGAEMASYQKAAYLGLKAGAPGVIACQNVFASPHPNVLADFDANRPWPYFDTFNLHHYFAVEELPGIYAAFRTVSAGKPLWVTEFNHAIQWTGDPVWQEPNREGLRRQAERVARVFAAALYEGPAVLFYFMLPHYGGGQTQFGLLHRDLTPRLAYLSLAAVGRLLADAKPIGKLGSGPGLQLFAFQARPDGEERDVLVGWSMDEEHVLQMPNTPIAVYDYIGRPMTNASKSLAFSRAPVFAVFEHDALTSVPWTRPPPQPPLRSGFPSPVVLQAVLPKDKVIADLSAYRCSSVESNAIPVFAYNFGKEKITGHLAVTPPAGWRVTMSSEVELAPGERKQLPFTVDCSSGTLAPAESIRINGDFGPAGEAVLSFRLAPQPFKLNAISQPIPRWAQPDAWKPSITRGGEVKISPADNSGLTVTASFGSAERWVYPEHDLTDDQRPKPGSAALAVTLTSSETEADFRVIFEEENGSLYFAGFFPPPKPGETVEAVALLSTASFGEGWSPPDDNHRLDLDKIRRIKIGCNPAGPRVTYTLKNLRWLKPAK